MYRRYSRVATPAAASALGGGLRCSFFCSSLARLFFTQSPHLRYPNIVRIWKAVTYSQAKGCFGFEGSSNIGQSAFPAIQAAPSFASSFGVPLGGSELLPCLIPCAIDQVSRATAHRCCLKNATPS